MRSEPLAVRLALTLVMILFIAQWCVSVLGISRIDLLVVVTFAWATTTARRLVGTVPDEPRLVPGRRLDFLMSAAGGQIMWIVLPLAHRAEPDAWFWRPLALGPEASAGGALLLLGCALYPFLRRLVLRHERGSHSSLSAGDLDAPLLCFSLFLVSGSLIFAGVALASMAAMLLQAFRAPASEPAACWWGQAIPTRSPKLSH